MHAKPKTDERNLHYRRTKEKIGKLLMHSHKWSPQRLSVAEHGLFWFFCPLSLSYLALVTISVRAPLVVSVPGTSTSNVLMPISSLLPARPPASASVGLKSQAVSTGVIRKSRKSRELPSCSRSSARLGAKNRQIVSHRSKPTDHKMRVRVGNKISHYELIENGVSQGAVISPILFNIIVSNFLENKRNKSLLLIDDVTIFAQVHKGTGRK
jgi:hypothetical protein